MSLRRFATAALVLAATLLATGCLVPNGPVRHVIPDIDLPDPAAVQTSASTAQVYATNTWFWGAKLNVPTYRYNLSTHAVDGFDDALPDSRLPSWVQPNVADNVKFVWAPTVRVVGGKYLLMFTASRRSGWACIGAAYSSTPKGPFTATSTQWCSSAGGLLDPQLFVDAGGAVWVHYSLQNPNTRSSQIMAQQISFNGSSVAAVGAATTILTVSQARSVCGLRHPVTSCTVNPGSTPAGHFVENPAMVRDPHNSYDLLVSVGNWQDNSYRTVEVPCTAPNGGCLADYGAPIQVSDSNLKQLGGASLLRDDSPDNNRLFFHAKVGSAAIRTTHSQPTSAINGT
jgi:hypothetical protein